MSTNNQLDIEATKRGGMRISLEAALSSQVRMLEQSSKQFKYDVALEYSHNVVALLEELTRVTGGAPCVLTSPDKSSKPSSTD
jgi:hypothetical protein